MFSDRFAYLFSKEITKREDKVKNLYIRRLLSMVNNVFVWDNLPDEIPAEYIENALLLEGVVAFTPIKNKLTVVNVMPYGTPNKYYMHDTWIYTNPFISAPANSGNITTGKDCIVVYNDTVSPWIYTPSRDTIIEYAELLAATDISLKMAIKNTRLTFIGKATNQAEVASFSDMINSVYRGDPANCVLSNTTVTDGIETLPTVSHGVDFIRQLTECREYLFNSFLSRFGIFANTNLKRERALTDEIQLQTERPVFSIYSMFESRKKGVEKINEKYGTDITVSLNPVITLSNDNNGNDVPDEIENGGNITTNESGVNEENDPQRVIQSSDDTREQDSD